MHIPARRASELAHALDRLGEVAGEDAGRDVARDDATGADQSALPDRAARENGGVGADEDVALEGDELEEAAAVDAASPSGVSDARGASRCRQRYAGQNVHPRCT